MAALLPSLAGGALLLLLAVILHSCACLLRNYLAARRLDVPIRVIPFDHLNPLWSLPSQRVTSLLRRLPGALGDNNLTRYNYMGFDLRVRCDAHAEMGDVFAMVSPARIWLYLGHPDDISTMLRRHRDFPHDSELTAMLDVFGPNISTAQGSEWKKMRKLMASCFVDANYEVAWAESARQAADMVRYWGARPSVDTIAQDTRTLSLNVMARAGFGKTAQFRGHHEEMTLTGTDAAAGAATGGMSYKDALQMILENSIVIMVLGTRFLARPWLPRRLRRLHDACTSFQGYMTELFESEKRTTAEGRAPSGRNLMTSLVRASQQEASSSSSLTEEIYGNMFVFNFAGHDTTAHTFVFALYFLAAHPAAQDWMAEEILAVLGARGPEEWDYRADFQRLRRCLAVMLETLRLYSPVGQTKWTGGKAATFEAEVRGSTGSREKSSLVLPPRTMVTPSYASVHSDPRFWGEDAMVWQPERWIKKTNRGEEGPPGTGEKEEELMTPARGMFLPWSDGARDCPGRKFSQVEFVATMAALFRGGWRVEPAREAGETLEGARSRTARFMEEDAGMVLLVQMLHPERCPLVWKRTGRGEVDADADG